MFHKYNSFTNTLSSTDRVSAFVPQSFGTKETTNNFFVAPQPTSHHPPAASQSHAESHSTAKSVTTTRTEKTHAVAAAAAAHGHHSHPAPWEGVNLWRTPFKGDTDTVTQVKRNKGILDQYVENRIRRVQQLQLAALRNKTTPTWIMMPRDKLLLAAQGAIVVYVLYKVSTTVYDHLKAKDRLKLVKLFYKDNVD